MPKAGNKGITTEIVELEINSISPHPLNPKTHWDEGIESSIKKVGYIELVAVDEKNRLLAGEGRWNAMKKLGKEKIKAVRVSGMTEKQKQEYILASNKISERGGWNEEKLKEFGIDILMESGFGDEELGMMWDDVTSLGEDQFDIEKAIKETKVPASKRGDIYQLGPHRLMCGDSTVTEEVSDLMGGEKAHMIYCDPPYNIGLDYNFGMGELYHSKKNYGGKYGKKEDTKTKQGYRDLLDNTLKNAIQNSRQDAHFFYWCDQNYIWQMQQTMQENGLTLKRVCLWVKNGINLKPQNAFNKSYESCVYATQGKPYLNGSITNLHEFLNRDIAAGNNTYDEIGSIIDIWMAKRDLVYEHPTQKPISLHEKPLKRCTAPGHLILDLFGGSGSTMIACEQLKRKCYLMEMDPVFCDVIIKRWEAFTNTPAKLIGNTKKA